MSRSATNQNYKRSSRSRSRTKTKYKAGKITRNPFLNFLRDFRRNSKGLKLTELTKRAAEVWRNMNQREKSPYCTLAKQAPLKRSRRRRSSRRHRKSKAPAVKRRKRSRSQSVTINEKHNKIFPFPKDDIADIEPVCKDSLEPKIIELSPSVDKEDVDQ